MNGNRFSEIFREGPQEKSVGGFFDPAGEGFVLVGEDGAEVEFQGALGGAGDDGRGAGAETGGELFDVHGFRAEIHPGGGDR